MSFGKSNAFTFAFTFFRQNPQEVIAELQEAGFTGINLALNYHASRDYLLRQGPHLEYLPDGFHYYKPELSKYEPDALTPNLRDHLIDNRMLESVIDAATHAKFEVNAWAVFLHNSAIGMHDPEASVTNVYGNHFLSELCPSHPGVAGYVRGLSADLSSRGIASLAIESLHFHGARHGEHHERFFLELSPTTEFLLSLCFCRFCMKNFEGSGGDAQGLKVKVSAALKSFLDDADPWLGKLITQDFLATIIGPEILEYLCVREKIVASLYQDVSNIAHAEGITTRLIDQSPLIDSSNQKPLDLSWLVGIDNHQVRNLVDIYEPLIYRQTPSAVKEIGTHYKQAIGGDVVAILRPTFPDNQSAKSLQEKVSALKSAGISDIDFYLLDAMRPRDLKWIKEALF